jgi:hypothetical protein
MSIAPSTLGKLLAIALAALAAACSPQGGGARDASKQNAAERNQTVVVDLCAVARHPERFDRQHVRVRAIFVPDVEYPYLVSAACIGRRSHGNVGVDMSREWDTTVLAAAMTEATRRSTPSRNQAAEGEFEGI